MENAELVFEFSAALEKVSGKAHRVDSLDAAAERLVALLRAAAPRVFAVAPLPGALHEAARRFAEESGCAMLGPHFNAAELPLCLDPAEIGITFADFAIAETGTLVEVVANDARRLISAMPRTHIAMVNARDFVPTLRGAAARMRQIFEQHGSGVAVSFISGPSRTGDIEMILTLGVHGPETVHVIVIEEDTP